MMMVISKEFKYLIISFLLSFLFFGGVNYLENNLKDFFFWQEIAKNPQILTAQLAVEFEIENIKPIRKKDIPNFELEAKSGISVLVRKNGSEKVLFEKNPRQRLSIASLTKLMTALLVLDNYELSQIVEISEKLPENNSQLKVGEKFEIGDLLYFLLITSDNQAAQDLAKIMGFKSFVFLMNKKTQELGMTDTFFVNPTGLDPNKPSDLDNFSTARDLIILGKTAFANPTVLEILGTPEIEIYSRENLIIHKLKNTNELLGKLPEILVGKTGWTPQAGGCLIVVTKAPKNRGEIISVILGSDNRFEEMKKLIDWVYQSYQW